MASGRAFEIYLPTIARPRASSDRPKTAGISGGRSLPRRVLEAARAEFGLSCRTVAMNVLSRGLPQFAFNRTRTLVLRAAGVSIGAGTQIMGSVQISGFGSPSLLSFGENTLVSGPLLVDLGAPVSIGSRVHLGQEIMLLTMDHEFGPPEERCGTLTAAPIRIEDGVWIASRATILPGITVGRGSVVATGALVTSDVPPNTVVGGVPSRVLRNLDELEDDAPLSVRRGRARPATGGD